MKFFKTILFVIAMLFANTAWSDTVIQMEEYGGVYRIPCTVNGAKMKFIFDTGASNVSLSMPMAEYLFDNDYIKEDDLIGIGKAQTADGTIIDHLKINLRKIEIGGLKLTNVEAIVIASQNAPLLLGQSAIQKLGQVQLNGDKLIISGGKNGLSEEAIDRYGSLADNALQDGEYAKAENYYSILYNNDALSEYGITEYARACNGNKNYSLAIKLYRGLLSSNLTQAKSYTPVSAQFNLYVDLAHAYVLNDQSDWGKEYIDKGLDLVEGCDYSGTKLNANMIKETIAQNFAATLRSKNQYSDAADYYFKALGFASVKYNLTSTSCWNKCVSKIIPTNLRGDKSILNTASNYAECQWLAFRWNDKEFTDYITLLARNGSDNARMFCNENGIQY